VQTGSLAHFGPKNSSQQSLMKRDLCRTPLLARFRRPAQNGILEIFNPDFARHGQVHCFTWKNREGLMVIRAFVHRVKVGRQSFAADEAGRAVTLCRWTRRQRLQVATPACRHGNAELHKNPLPPDKVGRAVTLCRQTRRWRVRVATPACRHRNADLHKNPLPPDKVGRAATLCRR